jgi:cell shape-determining protein MreC
LFHFRIGIFNSLSTVSHVIFRPVLIAGNYVGEKLGSVGAFFISKDSLYLENENLKLQLNENKALMSNYNSLLADNTNLREILGRKDEKMPMILGTILSKPNQSLYDTVVIDAGAKEGLKVGDMVFALGHSLTGEALGTVPIGRVSNVYPNSSKIILFSNSGEKTQVVIGNNIFMEVIGRGGGNFEMILPRNLTLAKGDQVVLPGIVSRVLAVVETIISDPRDPFIKALLTSPVNIQELKFVEVEVVK